MGSMESSILRYTGIDTPYFSSATVKSLNPAVPGRLGTGVDNGPLLQNSGGFRKLGVQRHTRFQGVSIIYMVAPQLTLN